MVVSLGRYRRFIWQRALMDLRHRYAGTGFGFGWNIIHPLAIIGVYSLVFGVLKQRLADDIRVPYAIFLCAGLLPWIGFSECLTRGCQAFHSNATYLKKLPVPEQVFVAQAALTATLNLCISFVLLIIISVIFGLRPGWTWLLIPLPLALLQAAGLGLGLAAGTLNVFLPDVGQAVPVGLRLSMWLAPVIFPMSFYADAGLEPVLMLNPATPAINGVRDLFIHDRLPSMSTWLIMIGWVVAAWTLGLLILRRFRREIRDVL